MTTDITLAPTKEINLKLRSIVYAIESKVKSLPWSLGEDPFPLKHSFAEGIYIREIFIPKGYLLCGKLHRDSYFNCILTGDIAVLTEEGVKRVKAPSHIVSPPGTKRFGYSYEDTAWITIHANPDNLTDIDALEDLIHVRESNPFDNQVNVPCLEYNKFMSEVCRFDIEKFRYLTKEIFDHEKPGFWSDWTEEQQKIYMSGDWEAFSRSRGYSEEEIEILREWIAMKELGEEKGLQPLNYIADLSTACAEKNIRLDKNNEILKSSHIPSNKKIPYK